MIESFHSPSMVAEEKKPMSNKKEAKKNSRVGYPPRPWFIYPADLEQLWLVIPGCLFLCILKQGIALAILVVIWWLISKSVDAQKSWEHM